MFALRVDQDIELVLATPDLAPQYTSLVEANRDYLNEWLHWPRLCLTEEHFTHFLRDALHQYADGKAMVCAIYYRGELAGNCSFNAINHTLKRANIGYWLAENFQGKGIMTRVCRFLIDYAFTKLDIEKVEIVAAEGNRSSRAVAERLGMTLEGTLSHREKVGDRILSHAYYAAYQKNNH
ncbi:GNAT family N-acetyltransferase [Parendozoicomonas haliclonae]|uniref:Putative ribosomal N-acetyltransferase YdaF n=1 Tax=Parendozoicomonas haliclonae TaxID=1960125 RepID=A0A1X7AGH2_9GAMM|nr:GNAT family protein [Parendozoicomonas haliclonae]SMA38780.1 putative ribosomal N-acetyltransferase YdaF [Parendozoicomonas haliclonae]